jgi:hypothetical protein
MPPARGADEHVDVLRGATGTSPPAPRNCRRRPPPPPRPAWRLQGGRGVVDASRLEVVEVLDVELAVARAPVAIATALARTASPLSSVSAYGRESRVSRSTRRAARRAPNFCTCTVARPASRARMPVGKPVVLDFRAGARLSARRLGLQHHGAESLRGAVDRGRKAAGPAPTMATSNTSSGRGSRQTDCDRQLTVAGSLEHPRVSEHRRREVVADQPVCGQQRSPLVARVGVDDADR